MSRGRIKTSASGAMYLRYKKSCDKVDLDYKQDYDPSRMSIGELLLTAERMDMMAQQAIKCINDREEYKRTFLGNYSDKGHDEIIRVFRKKANYFKGLSNELRRLAEAQMPKRRSLTRPTKSPRRVSPLRWRSINERVEDIYDTEATFDPFFEEKLLRDFNEQTSYVDDSSLTSPPLDYSFDNKDNEQYLHWEMYQRADDFIHSIRDRTHTHQKAKHALALSIKRNNGLTQYILTSPHLKIDDALKIGLAFKDISIVLYAIYNGANPYTYLKNDSRAFLHSLVYLNDPVVNDFIHASMGY